MLVFPDIFRQDSRFVLLLCHFGWSLHSWKNSGSRWWRSVEQVLIEALNSSGPWQVFGHSCLVSRKMEFS